MGVGKKISIYRPCEVRQAHWPALKPSRTNEDKINRFVDATFCYRVTAKDKHSEREITKWLEENLSPSALIEANGLYYWTDGVWVASRDDDLIFDPSDPNADEDDDGVVYMFLSNRDAAAFKLRFG